MAYVFKLYCNNSTTQEKSYFGNIVGKVANAGQLYCFSHDIFHLFKDESDYFSPNYCRHVITRAC